MYKTYSEILREESCKLAPERKVSMQLDEKLHKEYQRMQRSTNALAEFRRNLPVYASRTELLEMIERHQVILVKGETGSGKTTQIPQYILEQASSLRKGSRCRILCTQPRRIAAITLARRVAKERSERLGHSVGYQIRLEGERPRPNGSIMFCTTGIVLSIMQSDPLLREYSHLVLDEIHERDVITDLLLAIIRMVLPYRKDLRVILMSATLMAEKFSEYFHRCPMVQIRGITYPVLELYLEDVLDTLDKCPTLPRKERAFDSQIIQYQYRLVEQYIALALETLCSFELDQNKLIVRLIWYITTTQPEGAILVFLPSVAQIHEIYEMVRKDSLLSESESKFVVHLLHSKLPTAEQQMAFDSPPDGTRKIILSTDIAETSVTIEDVVYVVNTGRRKVQKYENNILMLHEEWISLANEVQRKGRAGRVKEGTCYHLYCRARQRTFRENASPQILNVALDRVIVQMKLLRLGDVRRFMSLLLDKPSEATIQASLQMLHRLNLIDDEEQLTPLGYHLGRLSLDPQAGKMVLLASIFGCIEPISSIAASLSFKDPFSKPFDKDEEVLRARRWFSYRENSDHIMLANVTARWRRQREICKRNFINSDTVYRLITVQGKICTYLYKAGFLSWTERDNNLNASNNELLKAIIAAGHYPNVAFVKSAFPHPRFSGVRRKAKIIVNQPTADNRSASHGIEVQIDAESVIAKKTFFESCFVVYNNIVKHSYQSAYIISKTTMVNPMPLLFFGDCSHVTVKPIHEKGNYMLNITIAGHHCMQCDRQTFALIQDLREEFNFFLQGKLVHPSPVNWASREGDLLRAVIKLITFDFDTD
ncbi:ATP-dependent DNA/RNA helicase DHX36-like [Anopheles cruzii]|uniref:ATP-dependent DNA/RNA helicase DHX36-like n=1 Tax=Anopheles cruzii TaxID=68878 RepID=UPI0022EC492B|nr:ATP-dependent DNA/RNA helicase DHX36-like [Anopheles cruzii]